MHRTSREFFYNRRMRDVLNLEVNNYVKKDKYNSAAGARHK